MKIQLSTFMAGGGEEIVLAAGGKGNNFHIPPSPAVKHHFRELVQKAEGKVEEMLHHESHTNGSNETNGIATRQVQKVQEKAEKVHEKVEKMLHHEDHSHVVNEDATNGDFNDLAVKEATNGHVEKAKDDLRKCFHHEKQSSADSAIFLQSPIVDEHAVNGRAVDDSAVKEVTNGDAVDGVETNGHLVEPVSSTDEFPRIYEDQAETKTMEVSSQFLSCQVKAILCLRSDSSPMQVVLSRIS